MWWFYYYYYFPSFLSPSTIVMFDVNIVSSGSAQKLLPSIEMMHHCVYFCSSYRSVPSSHCPTSFWKNATEGRGKAWRERTLSHTGCLSFCLVRNGQENGSNQMKRNGKIKPTKPFHTRPGSSSLTNLRLLFLSRSSFPLSCVTSRMHTVSLVLTACATYWTMMFHNPSTTTSVTVPHFFPPVIPAGLFFQVSSRASVRHSRFWAFSNMLYQ